MSHWLRRIAEHEAGIEMDEDGHYSHGSEVYCTSCEKMTTLTVEDHSFGHEFGTEYRYAVVTCCCGGQEYRDRGPCKFAVKLPSGRMVCDMKDEDICECDNQQNDDCSAWEEK